MENFKNLFSENENIYSQCMQINARPAFVRKVYGILSAQLLFTFLLSFIAMNIRSFQIIQLQYIGIFYFCVALTIILPIILMCNRNLAREVPTNYIILSAFTFSESYLISTVCSLYDPKIVSMAAFLTMGITFSLTLYAMTTKKDITYFGGIIFMLSFGIFFAGLARFFFYNGTIEIIYSFLGALLYGIYIIYDTQLIIGGKRGVLEIDEYIFASMMLYLDIIALFLKVLKLLDSLKKEEKKK